MEIRHGIWRTCIFFETLVRIHRAGEGAPYTGLKLGPNIDPAVALADKALESGSVDKLVNILADATDKGIRERFDEALKAKKDAGGDLPWRRRRFRRALCRCHPDGEG